MRRREVNQNEKNDNRARRASFGEKERNEECEGVISDHSKNEEEIFREQIRDAGLRGERSDKNQGHSAENQEVHHDRRAKKFSDDEFERSEPCHPLVIESVQFFFAVDGLEAIETAGDKQSGHLDAERPREKVLAANASRIGPRRVKKVGDRGNRGG